MTRRIAHGSTSPQKPKDSRGGHSGGEKFDSGFPAHSPDFLSDVSGFGYLFRELADTPAALLPESPATLDGLARLGDTMGEAKGAASPNSNIPSAYTYFGQFLDHDITFTHVPRTPPELTDSCMLDDPLLKPWPIELILRTVKNTRGAVLELDGVYGGSSAPPREDDPRLLKLGRVTQAGDGLPGQDDANDLPRGASSHDKRHDRVARIGDRRNDQNLIISQLHVAFLRAHNRIVQTKQCSFEEARTLLRQHYHWIIIHDFLKKQVADAATVEAVLSDPAPLYNPPADKFFLPLEFSVAAFRFGHSMIRDIYYYNFNYQNSDLATLFTLRALGRHPTLPRDKIIQWEKFLPGGDNRNKSRRIDTGLVDPLRRVLDEAERPVPCETRLAVQDLKRGYMMRIPTGQALAQKLGLQVMTAQKIEAAARSERQIGVLRDTGFSERTPLWFYILAEAARGEGNRLGPVGSRLVAEVLVGLVRRSEDSILRQTNPPWTPTLKGRVEGQFDLADLLRLAGVLKD